MSQCAGCGAPVGETEVACPRCQTRPSKPPAAVKWYHRRWVALLGISPLFLGPFGLPLLWRSPEFSPRGKLIWTLITIGWSVGFIWYGAEYLAPAIRHELDQLNAAYQF